MKISLPLGIALVMMGTHGYGLFLFGAILPTLQARHGFDYLCRHGLGHAQYCP